MARHFCGSGCKRERAKVSVGKWKDSKVLCCTVLSCQSLSAMEYAGFRNVGNLMIKDLLNSLETVLVMLATLT